MILFKVDNREQFFYPLVSAKYSFESKSVMVSQTYNETSYVRMKLDLPYRILHITQESYLTIRNFYYELCESYYTPSITFLKNASDNLAFFRITHPSLKGVLTYNLDAIFLVERDFDFKKSFSNAILMKRFLKFIKDGLQFLETYYGKLPF